MTAKDGYKILTYLHGEKTAEVDCKDRIEAHDLLTALTLKASAGIVSASDSPVTEVKIKDLKYDKAEMWRDGELIAFGLKPEKEMQR